MKYDEGFSSDEQTSGCKLHKCVVKKKKRIERRIDSDIDDEYNASGAAFCHVMSN